LQVDPDKALESTNRKFINRFQAMEMIAKASGKELATMSLTEMDAIWNEVKKQKD
jgi:XTP/dITP diphosphohydrolase